MTKTFWESSKRPLYIRNVWINGSRHAILTQDDPHLKSISVKRPKSTQKSRRSSYVSETETPRIKNDFTSELKNCIIKLQIVVDKNTVKRHRMDSTSRVGTATRNRSTSIKRSISFIESTSSEFESFIQARLQRTDEILQRECENRKVIVTNPQHIPEKNSNDLFDKNTLAERVLQWLDLAGGYNQIVLDSTKQKKETKKVETNISRPVKSAIKTPRKLSIQQTNKIKEVKKDVDSLPSTPSLNEEHDCNNNSENVTTNNTKETSLFPFKLSDSSILNYSSVCRSTKRRQTLTFTRNTYHNKESICDNKKVNSHCNDTIDNDNVLLSPTIKRQLHIFMPNLPPKCHYLLNTNVNSNKCDSNNNNIENVSTFNSNIDC